jgi:hypothetical protein
VMLLQRKVADHAGSVTGAILNVTCGELVD